ncbi:CD209 antigen-like protein E [Xenopus laevis]|uniref:CD209 antigen-like protein E n=1 Tax=Xenopus laevis TaxID=8355 RepID=A0A8J0UW74_XENLA|nr:CD209 antigen-like protein E [Xenopus laevis]
MESEITYAEIRFPQEPGGSKLTGGKIKSPLKKLPTSKRQHLLVVLTCCSLFFFCFIVMTIMYILASVNLPKASEEYKAINSTLLQHRAQSEELQLNYTKFLRCMIVSSQSCEVTNSSNSLKSHMCPVGWLIHNASCYYFSKDKLTWEQSKNVCESWDSHLLTINSLDEQKFITETRKCGNWWMGLNDLQKESEFRWVDGSAVEVMYWDRLQPDNYREAEHCATIGEIGCSRKDNNWNDDRCERPYSYVCEKEAETLLDFWVMLQK